MSRHDLAVALIFAVFTAGNVVFLALAWRRPRAREGEQAPILRGWRLACDALTRATP